MQVKLNVEPENATDSYIDLGEEVIPGNITSSAVLVHSAKSRADSGQETST